MLRQALLKFSAVILAVAWLFLVTFSYYIAHKPFGIENVLAILSALGDVLTAGALYVLAAALGRRIIARFQFNSALEEIVVGTGLGLGLVSFAMFGLGLIGALNLVAFWLGLLLGLVLLRDDVRAVWRLIVALRFPFQTRFEIWLGRFCILGLGIAFLFALCPSIGWDGLQYHLVGPKLAMAQGRIDVPTDNLSLSNPALVEMLFLAAMQLKSDTAAQLMHWGYLPLLLGATLAFAQRYFTALVGWLAMAILIAVPSLLTVSTYAYNDVALAFYSVMALWLAFIAREEQERRWFILAGIFAGLAMGEKYTAAFVALGVLGLVVRPQRQAIGNALSFVLSAGIVASPWLIRNWIFVGNPIYPFVWGGLYWTPFRADWYSRFGTGLITSPFRLLLVPWEATVIGDEGVSEYQATIGALLLMLIPLGLLTFRASPNRSNILRPLWFFVGLLYLVWLVGVAQSQLLSQTRLLFPAFPALALLAADSFERLGSLDLPQFSVRRFATLVIGLGLILTAVSYSLAVVHSDPFAYLVGYESREQYLARALGDYYAVANFVNTTLPSDARVLFLWETRPYYFQRTVTEDPILDRWAHQRYLYRDPNVIAEHWRREGYTHVLLYRAGLDQILQSGYDPVSGEDASALADLLTRYGKQLYGKTALQITTRGGKPAVLNAETDLYAVYEIFPQ